MLRLHLLHAHGCTHSRIRLACRLRCRLGYKMFFALCPSGGSWGQLHLPAVSLQWSAQYLHTEAETLGLLGGKSFRCCTEASWSWYLQSANKPRNKNPEKKKQKPSRLKEETLFWTNHDWTGFVTTLRLTGLGGSRNPSVLIYHTNLLSAVHFSIPWFLSK